MDKDIQFNTKTKKSKTISGEFMFTVTSVMIFLLFFIGLFSVLLFKQISQIGADQYRAPNDFVVEFLTPHLKNYVKTKDKTALKAKFLEIANKNIIDYVIVENTSKNAVDLMLFPETVSLKKNSDSNTKISQSKEQSFSFLNYYENENMNKYSYYVRVYLSPSYSAYIGFKKESPIEYNLKKMELSSFAIVFIMLALAILVSRSLSNMITKPLVDLVKGTKEYAQGNLSNRMENTGFLEVDELINSFNFMAANLNSLYQSLEQKVEERTFALNQTLDELKSTQAMMVHSEKMKSLGELVAGITHEINNPVNFIYGNLVHLKNYSSDLIEIIDKFTEFEDLLPPDKIKEIKQLKEDLDYEFLKDDLPSLIKSCHEGTERTKNIIMDLKNFSRLDETVLSEIDVSNEIDTTLNILHNKLKNRIEIHKEYDDNFPKIVAHGGQLNQVFMNILDNAAFAIADKGDIYIRLKKRDPKTVTIEFEDNGCGMTEEVAEKVFNPFFTTKEVGKGTGLGMSISYKVIKNHKGDIKLKSEVGKGSKFTITLPIDCAEELNRNA